MPESAIKHQLGHAPDSRVMESTYSHLKDSDHIREAREAFDLETDDPDSELTPEVCPQCGTNPPENARLCHICGLEFTPDAKEHSQEADDKVRESYQDVDPENMDTVDKLQLVDDILDDPEVKDMMIDRKEDE
ncbi:XerC/D-like integrase [Halosimplex carlsbadense 2-9-1]|uniref:XerC/D-like integrase n=2 Tax=Halosimplex carlsbadense TaxID=171164 RepID=M0CR87_9EURY|nr:XerC/D-like integrase [Halosimplex carlsbadense 2-9-1]